MPIAATQEHSSTDLASLMKLISSKKFGRSMTYFGEKVTIFILKHNRSTHFISYFKPKGNISNNYIIIA